MFGFKKMTRYIVLDHETTTLTIAHNKRDAAPKEMKYKEILWVETMTDLPKPKDWSHWFRVATIDRMFKFFAIDSKECDLWVQAFIEARAIGQKAQINIVNKRHSNQVEES